MVCGLQRQLEEGWLERRLERCRASLAPLIYHILATMRNGICHVALACCCPIIARLSQQQHSPNAVQMSQPSSFHISLTLHRSYQVRHRALLDNISQHFRKPAPAADHSCTTRRKRRYLAESRHLLDTQKIEKLKYSTYSRGKCTLLKRCC